MKKTFYDAILVIAACALSTGATAQTTYKCGNSYGATACPGGVVIDSADPRTAAQKAQTDLAAARDARVADAMEKARLEQERRDLAANTPRVKKVTPPVVARKSPTKRLKKWKKKPAGYFVAQAPGQKKKQQNSKKGRPKSESVKP